MGLEALDGWSPTHWVLGFIVTYSLLSRGIDLIYLIPALLIWEIFEYILLSTIVIKLKVKGTRRFPAGRDSGINIISDIIFGLIGALFAYYVYIT